MPAVLSKPLRGEFNESNWTMRADLNKFQSEVKLTSGSRKNRNNEAKMHFFKNGIATKRRVAGNENRLSRDEPCQTRRTTEAKNCHDDARGIRKTSI